jgi:hypothetical protein
MNINSSQIKALRQLITKKDKQTIHECLGNSVRTIEAVMNCDRANNEIEFALFRMAKTNHAKLSRILAAIEAQNKIPIDIESHTIIKESPQWVNDDYYQRYNDIYLQLCSFNFSTMDEIWEQLKNKYQDILLKGNYCCDLIAKLVGVDAKTAINFYNNNI